MRTSLMESAPTRSRTHPNIPRRITHPDLPKGQPILTFPKGRNKLLCFVKDFFKQSYQPPPSLKPILTFPKGRNKLLRQLSSAPT